MASASRIGTITDPLKGRIVTDEFFNEVAPGSSEATFVWAPADLAIRKARREALGLGTDGEAKTAAESQRASRVIEAANAERRIATLEAEIAGIRAAVKADAKADKADAKA